MKVTHRIYDFTKPNLINEEQYQKLKEIFTKNIDYSLEPKNEFWNEFGEEIKNMFYFTIVGILLCIFSALTNWKVFSILGCILLFPVFLGITFKYAWEWLSYSYNLWVERNYYRKLSKKIKTSENYKEFRSKNKFWINMHPNT